MSLTEISLRRPAFITMVVLAMVSLGLYSLGKLGVDLYPNVNFPVVTVSIVYPGANPQEVETTLSKPIEEAVGTIAGIEKIESYSLEGYSLTLIEFKLEANLETITVDVQKKIDAIANQLPKEIEKPVITKADINAFPIMTVSVSGVRPAEEMFFIVKDQVKPQLEQVSGVARVDLVGGLEREIQIQLRPEALAAHDLSIAYVAQALRSDNITVPGGSLAQGALKTDIRVLGEFKSLNEIRNWPLRLPNGSRIPLARIAYVKDTHKKLETINRTDRKPSLGLVITKQSDASIVAVAEDLRETLAHLPGLPKDVKANIVTDASIFIENSLDGVKDNLLEGVLFTAVILLLFLGSVSSTFIVLLAIPTSLISTFVVMFFAGFTINMMTLMAMALTIGILVDDSIVVLENIHRHLEKGEEPFQAALKGRTEIAMAAISITLVDVVVFLPIAFMGGIVGQFFKPFALTVVTATLCSLFISFTLTPMLCRFFLHIEEEKRFIGIQWLFQSWEKMFHALQENYRRLIHWSLHHKTIIILVSLASLFWSLSLVPRGKIGGEFLPSSDRSEFTMNVTLPVNTPLHETSRVGTFIEKELTQVPEVKSFFTTIGNTRGGDMSSLFSGSVGGSNNITVNVSLLKLENRKRGVEEIMTGLRRKFKALPGATVAIQGGSAAGGTQAPIQMEIFGNNLNETRVIAAAVFHIVQKTKGTVDVRNSWFEGKQEYVIAIDREQAAAFGLSVFQIASAVRTALDGEVISRYREEGREADIRLIAYPASYQAIKALSHIPLITASGKSIELSQVAHFKRSAGPSFISRKNRQRRIVISANITGRSVNAIRNDIQQALKKVPLPKGVTIGYGRSAESQAESFKELLSALFLSIALIYMLMVALYESYLHPFTIMFSLPVALVGGLGALAFTGRTINIFSLIGIIMLMGLVAKNAILLVDFTNRLREEGKEIKAALIEAGAIRLRPILMTTMAMVFGMLPLAVAVGSGAETRSGLATVVIGGLLSSLLLTLVLIPVVYLLADQAKQFLQNLSIKRRKRSRT